MMPHGEVKISILVLDDDNDDLYIITRMIEEMGITNYQMYNDVEIFMKAMNKDAHVCIIDHVFPKGNGLDLLYQIKSINPDNFVIGYSGIGDDIDLAFEYLNGDLERFVRKGEKDEHLKLQKFINQGFKEVELRVRRQRAYEFIRQEKDKLSSHDAVPI